MIGDKAAAACEIKPKPEHDCRFNEPLMGHSRCRISRPASFIPKPDSGWTTFVASVCCQHAFGRASHLVSLRFRPDGIRESNATARTKVRR
jgi:hypothetical protein